VQTQLCVGAEHDVLQAVIKARGMQHLLDTEVHVLQSGWCIACTAHRRVAGFNKGRRQGGGIQDACKEVNMSESTIMRT